MSMMVFNMGGILTMLLSILANTLNTCHGKVDCGTVHHQEQITNVTFSRTRLPIPPTGQLSFTYSFIFNKKTCCPIISIETNSTLVLNNHKHVSRNCYKKNIKNLILTSQLYIYLNPNYINSGCKAVGDNYECNGTREYYIGYEDQWLIDIGYKCTEENTLDIAFQADLQCNYPVVCQELIADYCRSNLHYTSTAFPNTLGLSLQKEANVLLELVLSALRRFKHCYQHVKEFVCLSFFPKCQMSKAIIPCRETCQELKLACGVELDHFNQPFYCGSYPSRHDQDICFYEPVKCSKLQDPKHGKVLGGNDIYFVHDTIIYNCQKGYKLEGNSERHCMYSGLWNGSEPSCVPEKVNGHIVITVVVLCTATICIVTVLCILYRAEINLRLVHGHFFSRNVYTLENREQLFVSFSSEDLERLESVLLPSMKKELIYWRPVTYQESFRADRTIVFNIATVIDGSKAALVLLTQNYLDSEWCRQEFTELQTRCITDDTFTLIVILFEEGLDDEGAETFCKKLPATMWTWMKTRLYLRLGQPQFWNKLRRGLGKKRRTDKRKTQCV